MKGSTAFIAGQQTRSLRQLVLKRLNSQKAFRERFIKTGDVGGIVRSVISFPGHSSDGFVVR